MRSDDFNWFVEHYSELYEKYGVSYIAIKDKTVLGAYQNPRVAIDEISRTLPLGQFIVQFCNGDSSGYTNYIASTQISVI